MIHLVVPFYMSEATNMVEKVNMYHPDKIADRVSGALVDLAYKETRNPRIAVEVLIGHGKCHIIAETSVILDVSEVKKAVKRIAGRIRVDYVEVPQDPLLASNQEGKLRVGDNGIFFGAVRLAISDGIDCIVITEYNCIYKPCLFFSIQFCAIYCTVSIQPACRDNSDQAY